MALLSGCLVLLTVAVGGERVCVGPYWDEALAVVLLGVVMEPGLEQVGKRDDADNLPGVGVDHGGAGQAGVGEEIGDLAKRLASADAEPTGACRIGHRNRADG